MFEEDKSETAEVSVVELPELAPSKGGKQLVMRKLDIIGDVQVNASVVLGSADISVKRLYALKEGDVLELDRPIDAPVDVLVEGHCVAHGKIVVVGDQFGILITAVSDQ